MSELLTVVKVGGSLFDLPDLAERLRMQVERTRVLLFPGGGATADAVRTLDQTHRLGEEASHWLALQALALNARFLSHLLPGARVLSRLPRADETGALFILDPLPFFQEDEERAGRFPHRWQVTSDSLAVRVAAGGAARELVLLKSVDWPEANGWVRAAELGVVDGFFEEALQRSPALRVRVVNLRRLPSGDSE